MNYLEKTPKHELFTSSKLTAEQARTHPWKHGTNQIAGVSVGTGDGDVRALVS